MRTGLPILAGLVVLSVATAAAAQPLSRTGPAGESAASLGQPGGLPAGSAVGFVDLARVAAMSTEGKALTSRLVELREKKAAEVADHGREVQALQSRLSGPDSHLSDSAREQLRRQFERAQVDFQRFSQDADDEVRRMREELQQAFATKLFPVIGDVAKEKNLWAVFSTETEGLLWHDPALDLSDEVARRMDASTAKTP